MSINEITAKNIAIKFNPPALAFEYTNKQTLTDYLLEVALSDQLKDNNNPNPETICQWIFSTYSDIINNKVFSEQQITNLVNRIIINYKTMKL